MTDAELLALMAEEIKRLKAQNAALLRQIQKGFQEGK